MTLHILLLDPSDDRETLRSRLALLVPPAKVHHSALPGAHFDFVLGSADALASAAEFWPDALACTPVVDSDGSIRLLALNPQQAALVHLLEQQLNGPRRLFAETPLTGALLDLHQVTEMALDELQRIVPFDGALIALMRDEQLRLVDRAGPSSIALSEFPRLVSESPLITQMLRQPILISDTFTHPVWRRVRGVGQTRSWVGVPLKSRGISIGVLALTSLLPDAYTEHHQNLLLTFSGPVAVAIDNALLFENINRREREARSLYEVTRLLVSLDQAPMAFNVMNKLEMALPFDAAVLLVAGESNHLVVRARQGVTEAAVADIEQRVIKAYEVLSQERLNQHTLERHVIHLGSAGGRLIEQFTARLSTPLLLGQHVIGVIELGSTDPAAYTEHEFRTLLIIANTIAAAFENARLYHELVARAAHLQQVIDELAEASRVKDEVVQDVSHDLRTPLTYILAYVELLLTGDMGELNADQQASLKLVSAKAKMLARMVSDILTVDKAALEQFELEPCDLAELASHKVEETRLACNDCGITLVAEIDHSVGPVMAHADRLAQVFDNLLGNAVKFSPAGSRITVRVFPHGQQVRVEIADTGIGIPADKLARIFDRFYQVDTTPHRRYGGAGLGLAISKRIIELHGGHIGVASEEGKGSTFYFELPYQVM